MNRFIQRHLWEGNARRTMTLGPDKLVIDGKKAGVSISDDYFYRDITPAVKNTRRGEPGWSSVIYGIVVVSLALFVATRMVQSTVAKMIILAFDYALLLIAGFFFILTVKKSDYADFYDADGDRFLSIKVTSKSKPFIAALRGKIKEVENMNNENAPGGGTELNKKASGGGTKLKSNAFEGGTA